MLCLSYTRHTVSFLLVVKVVVKSRWIDLIRLPRAPYLS